MSSLCAHSVLHEVFGYEQFRGPQQDIVEHVIAGGDALVLMPTGGGKSLCYQIPAIVRQRQGRGVAIVVSPLISLMKDQVDSLAATGVRAACYNSSLDAATARRVLARELQADTAVGPGHQHRRHMGRGRLRVIGKGGGREHGTGQHNQNA